jgi:hypothetical protein
MDEFRPRSYRQEMLEMSLRENIIVVVRCFFSDEENCLYRISVLPLLPLLSYGLR